MMSGVCVSDATLIASQTPAAGGLQRTEAVHDDGVDPVPDRGADLRGHAIHPSFVHMTVAAARGGCRVADIDFRPGVENHDAAARIIDRWSRNWISPHIRRPSSDTCRAKSRRTRW